MLYPGSNRDRPQLRAHNEELFLTLLAELAFETGIEETAATSARQALRLRPCAEYTARIERVLAMQAFNAGELASSIEHLESARAHAGQGRYLVLRASIELTYMWLALTFRSLETPLAALPQVRPGCGTGRRFYASWPNSGSTLDGPKHGEVH